MSLSQGSARPLDFPRDQAVLSERDGEPWPPMTDAEMDATYQRELAEREAKLVPLVHTHDCGHECAWNCSPNDRHCFHCEIRLQASARAAQQRGMNRRRVG